MEAQKLVSFDLRADFGFFKKPDYNDGLLLSYNLLHKPALLGILGAIIGLKGYQEKGEVPEYYQKLSNLAIGIEPIGHEKGDFQKTSVKYTNTVGYANQDGNLLIEESMLIKPGYRCYLLLRTGFVEHSKLYEYLKEGKAEYIPYLGKNEFQASWINEEGENSFREYRFERYSYSENFQISTAFIRENPIKGYKVELKPTFRTRGNIQKIGSFTYFERLPSDFDTNLFQYELADFAFSDWLFESSSAIENLYIITNKTSEKAIIQLY